MSKPIPYSDSHPDVRWLPVMDWNVKFFGAHQQRVSKNWSMPEESHVGFEINLLLDGRQETMMGKNRYVLKAGDIILIPPGFKHVNRCVSDEGMAYFCAHFNVDDAGFRQEMIRNNRILFPSGTDENAKLRNVLDNWIALTRRHGPYTPADRFRIQAQLFELFGILAQLAGTQREEQEALTPTALHYAKAMAEAIKANFDPHRPNREGVPRKAMRIEDIASSLGISPGYGLQVFRKVYGISPRRYLSELKLHEARLLIQQPDLSLEEIASRLGYSHVSHFSRQFKRWTGMSPLQYRHQAGKR